MPFPHLQNIKYPAILDLLEKSIELSIFSQFKIKILNVRRKKSVRKN